MKKNCYIVFFIFTFNLLAVDILAQERIVTDTENLLTKKEKTAFEKALYYQSDFFNRLFPKKTVNVSDINFVIVNNFAEYINLQSKYGLHVRHNSLGFFTSKDSTVVVFRNKKSNASNFLRAFYHELSHAFLYLHVDGNYVPAWLIEGLATYHEQMTYDKKKIRHHANRYFIARVKTLIALEDINLAEFVVLNYQNFSKESFTQEGYGYAIGYCMVLFLMQQCENMAFAIFRNLVGENSTIGVFDKYYLGGFQKFEKDFITYFGG